MIHLPITDLRIEAIKQVSTNESNPLSQAELENIQSAADTLAAIVSLPVLEAIEVLAHFRSVWTVELLTLASQKLTLTDRTHLKYLVVEMNSLRLAS